MSGTFINASAGGGAGKLASSPWMLKLYKEGLECSYTPHWLLKN